MTGWGCAEQRGGLLGPTAPAICAVDRVRSQPNLLAAVAIDPGNPDVVFAAGC